MGFSIKGLFKSLLPVLAIAALAFAAPVALPALMSALSAAAPALSGLIGGLSGSGLMGAFSALTAAGGPLASLGGLFSGTGLGTIGQFLFKAQSVMQLASMAQSMAGGIKQAFSNPPKGMSEEDRVKMEQEMRRNSASLFANRHAEMLKASGVAFSDPENVSQAIKADPNSAQIAQSLDLSLDEYIAAVQAAGKQPPQVTPISDEKLAEMGIPAPTPATIEDAITTNINNSPINTRGKSEYKNNEGIRAEDVAALSQPQAGAGVTVASNSSTEQLATDAHGKVVAANTSNNA